MTLEWNRLPGGAEMACGTGWTYLIARDSRTVALTRWKTSPLAIHYEVAAQAALHAIALGGPYGEYPDTAEVTVVQLMRAAQEYESGRDVEGHRAWRH